MSTSRRLVFALALAGGCAQVDSNALNPGTDSSLLPDLLSADVAQNTDPDFATTSTDFASSSVDMATGIQVCDLHKVRVNEVQTQGQTSLTDEFIELYNPCAASVSMAGATLVYRSYQTMSDSYTLWTFTTESIPSMGYFVIANTNFTGTANAKPFQNTSGLAQAGGGVGLRDAAEMLIDSVGWGTAANGFVENTAVGAPSATQSAARTHDGTDTNNNLADFSLGKPTPGATN